MVPGVAKDDRLTSDGRWKRGPRQGRGDRKQAGKADEQRIQEISYT